MSDIDPIEWLQKLCDRWHTHGAPPFQINEAVHVKQVVESLSIENKVFIEALRSLKKIDQATCVRVTQALRNAQQGVIEMDERETNSRLEALSLAVRHPLTQSNSAKKIIEDAEKYFTFLKGEESKES